MALLGVTWHSRYALGWNGAFVSWHFENGGALCKSHGPSQHSSEGLIFCADGTCSDIKMTQFSRHNQPRCTNQIPQFYSKGEDCLEFIQCLPESTTSLCLSLYNLVMADKCFFSFSFFFFFNSLVIKLLLLPLSCSWIWADKSHITSENEFLPMVLVLHAAKLLLKQSLQRRLWLRSSWGQCAWEHLGTFCHSLKHSLHQRAFLTRAGWCVGPFLLCALMEATLNQTTSPKTRGFCGVANAVWWGILTF